MVHFIGPLTITHKGVNTAEQIRQHHPLDETHFVTVRGLIQLRGFNKVRQLFILTNKHNTVYTIKIAMLIIRKVRATFHQLLLKPDR